MCFLSIILAVAVVGIPTPQAHTYPLPGKVTPPGSSISVMFLEINETYACLCEWTVLEADC